MQSGQQFEKNPNGGYLNRSNFGEDSWYGKVVITPELQASLQRMGAVLIEVKDIQTTQYGECRRIVAKEYTPAQPQNAPAMQQYPAPMQAPPQAYPPQAPMQAPMPAQAPAQGYAPPAQAQPAPAQAQPAPASAPAPIQGAPLQADEIPW